MAEITRDALLARQAQLAEEEKRAWANLNAVLGALQDVEHWLGVLAAPDPEEQDAERVAHVRATAVMGRD